MDTWSEKSPTKSGTGQEGVPPNSQKHIQYLVFQRTQYPDGVGLLAYSADSGSPVHDPLWAAWENAHVLTASVAWGVFIARILTQTPGSEFQL